MAIHYDLTVKGDTLQARAWGFDENLEDVQSYGLAIIQACREQGVTRVFCDERELEYRLNTFEHYEAAEFIAQQVPAVAKAAIVCNPQSLPAADLYEDVAVNRGLMLRIFTDIDQAQAWLEDSAPSRRAPGAAAPVASAPSSDAHRPPLPAVPRRRAVLSMMRPTVFLALLYFMLGGLGLALSHGGHLPLWPAAGLALAMVLHRGRRALPGIGLGAFLILSMQRLLTDPTPSLGWLTFLCLTFGAMLQAGIGAWLCRKHLEPGWESLERPRVVLQPLFWGGGIAPAIATSFNVMAMTLAGALTSETAGLTWWQGFVADALGIALFTPLGLFLLRRRVEAPGESGKASAARAALLAGSLLWPLYLFSMATPATMAQRTWGEALALPLDARRDSPFRRPHGAVLTGFLAALGLQLLLLRELGRIQADPPRREELDGALRHTLQLFNDSPLPAWVYDADSLSFLMVNEKAMALYGWPRADWPGLTLRDIVPAEDLLAYLAPAERSTTNPSGMERRHRRQDGTLITVRVNRSLTWHGERQARLEFIEDITERQKVERALIESEKRFRRLFEDSQQAILLFDNFHCIAANPAALAILRAAQRRSGAAGTYRGLDPGTTLTASTAEWTGHRRNKRWGSNYLPGFYGDFHMAIFPTEGTFLSQFLAGVEALEGQAGSVVEMPGIIHAPGWEVLGGHFAAAFYPNLTVSWDHTGTQSSERFGLGDFYLVPLGISWDWTDLHVVAFQGVVAPTGHFGLNDLNNSRNVWTFDQNVMLTWNLPAAMELNLDVGFMENVGNSATGYDSGDEFHLDYTVAHYVTDIVGLGFTGSYYRQITEDEAPAGAFLFPTGSATSIGPAVYFSPHVGDRDIGLSLKWLHEVYVDGRPRQDYLMSRVFLAF